jgi:hypothetical protein
MKKFLLILILWTGSRLESKCQSTDTLCIPTYQVKKLLIAAKQKDAADSLVSIYRSDISILSQKVSALEAKDSVNREISSTHLSMIATLNEEKGILQNQVSVLTRDLRKQKVKTKLTAIGGLVLTGIVTSLFIFK